MKAVKIRFERPGQDLYVRSCFKHVEKRALERFDFELDDFEHCLWVDRIQRDVVLSLGRVSTYQYWVSFMLNGKTCYALYNEALEVIQTVYTSKMFETERRKIYA